MLPVNRRATLGGLLAGVLGSMLPENAGATSFERYPVPVEITIDDIAWFRACRSVWIDGESGAPAVVPARMSLGEYPNMLSTAGPHDVRDRLERTLCAFCLHARFTAGHYGLAPPVPASEGFVGASDVAAFDVSAGHVRLLQNTEWRLSTINTKRPYGHAVYCEVDVARILGIPIPPLHDGESLPAEIDAPLRALHHDLLFTLQAYIQQAELSPGRYPIPFDGWDFIRPRCRPVTQARMQAYLRAWDQVRRQRFAKPSDEVVPVMRAAALLYEID